MKPEKHNDFGECLKCGKNAQLSWWQCEECNAEDRVSIGIDARQSDEEIEHLRADQPARIKLWGQIRDAVEKHNWHSASVIREVVGQTNYKYRTIEIFVGEFFDVDGADIVDETGIRHKWGE